MEVITSKKCTACLEVLPMRDYRFMATLMRYKSQCRHCESDASMDRQRKRKAREVAWTDAETDVVIERYADGGSAACLPYLPGRTKSQVQNKARGLGIRYEGPTVSGGNTKLVERNWEVPTHEYCEADLALRQWVVPGMGIAEPNLGTQVGVLSPSLGLVTGVAA